LQLLPGDENQSKTDKPLVKWLENHTNPDLIRSLSLIPDTDLSLKNFRTFYEAREQMLIEALKTKLGTITATLTEDDELEAEELMTGEVVEIQ
jgi:hypothetical protein